MFGTFAPAGWPPYPWALPKRPWRRSVRREAFTLPTWRAAVALRLAGALVSSPSSLSSLSSPLGAPREKGVIGGSVPLCWAHKRGSIFVIITCGNELQELLEFRELAKFVVAKSQIFIKELLEFRELAKFVGRCKISHEVCVT